MNVFENILRIKKNMGLLLEDDSTDEKKLNLVEKLVDQLFYPSHTYKFTINNKFLDITFILDSKKDDNENPIVFYSTWHIKNGNLLNYDTNSAYSDSKLFQRLALQRTLNYWMYNESKKIAEKIYGKYI